MSDRPLLPEPGNYQDDSQGIATAHSILTKVFAPTQTGFVLCRAQPTLMCVAWNTHILDRLFIPPAQLSADRPLSEVLGPQEFARLQPLIAQALASDQVVDSSDHTWRVQPLLDSGLPAGLFVLLSLPTERPLPEPAGEASDTVFRNAFAHAGIGMALVGIDGRFLKVNPALCRITGYSAAELLARTFQEITYPADLAIDLEHARRLQSGELETYSLDKRYIRADGSLCWVTLNASLIRDAHGEPEYFLAQIEDISARVAALHGLQAREARFRAIWSATNDAMALSDPDGVVVEVNPAYLELYGYSAAEVIGRSFAVIFPPEQREWAIREYRRTFHQAPPDTRFESLVRQRDGTDRTVESRATFLEEDGVRTAMLSVIRDISDRIAMEQALRAERDRLQQLLQSLSDLGEAVISGSEERIVYANAAFCNLSGYSQEELLAMPVAINLVDPAFRVQSQERLRNLQAGQVLDRYESVLRHKDGYSIPLEVSTHIVEIVPTRRYISVMRDIRERRRAAQQLRASLAEKEVLLQEVHHRVKNNLQVIISLLRLQAQQYDDAFIREQFRDTQNRVRAMALVHEQLYNSSDLASINLVAYIRHITTGILRSYVMQAGRITLDVQIDDRLELPIEPALLLGLVITELLSNSVKYAFPDDRHGCIDITARQEEVMLQLRISDNGIGLPEAVDLAHLTSLGLQLVQRLVFQLGGRLDVDRAAGVAFTITIPMSGQEGGHDAA